MENKIVTIDLKQCHEEAMSAIENIIIVYGFSYQACHHLDVKKIEIGSGLKINLFPDLPDKILRNNALYHEQYMNYISKKCIDDLLHILETFLISCFKELRLKLDLFKDEKIEDHRLKIWDIKRAFEKIGIKFDEGIFGAVDGINNVRKSIHYNGILQQDAKLKYKSFDVRGYGRKNDALVEIDCSKLIDTFEFDEKSIVFEFSKNLVDKTKEFNGGTFPTVNEIEFQELVMTVKDFIIPRLNKGLGEFLDNFLSQKKP